MRRLLAGGFAATLLMTAALPVAAVKPDAGCGAEPSGFRVVDKDGWWAATVAGFELEGISVYVGGDPNNGFTDEFDAFAVSAGFADGQALQDFVLGAQWVTIDKNDDLLVCMKLRTRTPGQPAYFLNGKDNTAQAG